MIASRKKTPADASDFEREQLRFFLSGDDLATVLSSINPSLAWLPLLSEMKLIQNETQLIAWIERNFSDVDALRDVVANIHFFGPETANFLEYRLNQQASSLSPLLAKSWALVIRYMRRAKVRLTQTEWFEIAPQLKRGETSASVLERLADVLRPKLKIGKRLLWGEKEEKIPARPSDLMSIDYEVDESVSSTDVLSAWPKTTPPKTDEDLLSRLTVSLNIALADAMDVGVESNEGFSTSDIDVPSVADHNQNEYRSGFQIIVRVMAELWIRLAQKSPAIALRFVETWRDSPFRLVRRLALFAASNSVIPNNVAADLLVEIPAGELFLTNSSVEVYQLIHNRWNDFSKEKQEIILRRLCEGPPRSWFVEGADVESAVDRCLYDIFSYMVRDGFDIGPEAGALLNRIKERWPRWEPKPSEQAGFHIWHGSNSRELGDNTDKLEGIPDGKLVAETKKIAASADFMAPDSWQGLCLSDPDRAVRGLDSAATEGDWPVRFWEQLLWAQKAYQAPDTESKIAELLLQWPVATFDSIAAAASYWLGAHAKTLNDGFLWLLWDRIADATLVETVEAES